MRFHWEELIFSIRILKRSCSKSRKWMRWNAADSTGAQALPAFWQERQRLPCADDGNGNGYGVWNSLNRDGNFFFVGNRSCEGFPCVAWRRRCSGRRSRHCRGSSSAGSSRAADFILGVAGASVGNLIKSAISNQEIAEKAEAASRTIIRETERIKEVDLQVLSWNRETIHLSNELMKKLTIIRRKRDYNLYSKAEKEELAMVMNMTEVLSKKLGEKIR